MPKTKKQSYAKRRERLSKMMQSARTNKTLAPKPVMATSKDLHSVIQIDHDNETIDVQSIVRRNQAAIRDCILDTKRELTDNCVNAFLRILAINTTFEPQDPIFYQGTHWYQRVTSDRDIQIIYRGDVGIDKIGHWTCIYYDGSVVHVYDTLKMELLPIQHEILKYLYGNYSIMYEDVQIQPDYVSCGVFACAIATSLALGKNPSSEEYFVNDDGQSKSTLTLRRHLVKVLDEELLTLFPTNEMRTFATTSSNRKTHFQS